MKATLEFSLPEERDEHRHAIRGLDYFSALWGITEMLRRRRKYTEYETDEAQKLIDEICHEVSEMTDWGEGE